VANLRLNNSSVINSWLSHMARDSSDDKEDSSSEQYSERLLREQHGGTIHRNKRRCYKLEEKSSHAQDKCASADKILRETSFAKPELFPNIRKMT
jgi:hypothetical protein